jgi:hypothetical protein
LDADAAGNIWIEAWLSILLRPRATIRCIIDADPRKFAVEIAFVAGVLAALTPASKTLAPHLSGIHPWTSAKSLISAASSAVPPIFGFANMNIAAFYLTGYLSSATGAVISGGLNIVTLYLLGALFRWSGAILGGTADAVQVRAALAWSQAPEIYLMIAGMIVAALGLTARSDIRTAAGIVMIWSFVISVKCLGEVHGFSAWRALGAVILGLLAIILVLVAVMITVHLAITAGRALA